ncbi:MAG: hypothetical protein LBB36_04875, partial [Fibromonadaceae bacterium]|nr:hypothetical protein [Fibromonadaceae bacterium]
MIEFLQNFYKDEEQPFLWHYVPVFDSVSCVEAQNLESLQPQILFENQNAEKLVLEIGSGKGAFLSRY